MRKLALRLILAAVLSYASVFAAANERAGFVLFFDAGLPSKGAEGRYGADFGKAFLDLSAQARLGGSFYAECGLAFFPNPRPSCEDFYDSDGFELALDGVWKIAAGKRIIPFVKIGLSYAWITANNAYMEQYYPDGVRQTDRWLGVNAGLGIESRLGRRLLLRLGGTFTIVPNDGEGAVASWGKLFAGLGFRVK